LNIAPYLHLEVTESGSDGHLVRLPLLRALGNALDDRVRVQRRVQALRRQVLLPLDAGAKTPPESIHFARASSFKGIQILENFISKDQLETLIKRYVVYFYLNKFILVCLFGFRPTLLMINFGSILTTFEVNFIFKAAGEVV
jgi:hypothetical protein